MKLLTKFSLMLSIILFSQAFILAFSNSDYIIEHGITGVLNEPPEQLFDIRFEVENSILTNLDKLEVTTYFESFGTVPTSVNLTYTILDQDGNQYYETDDLITVETENILHKKFENLDLEYGKYFVFLKTVYGNNIEDTFFVEFDYRRVVGEKSENQLFDITFHLSDNKISSPSELIGVVTFESFGSEPTPVNLKFVILDSNKNKIYETEDNLVVQTEEVLNKEFGAVLLQEGEYTMILTTLYNVDVEDEFRETFVLKSKSNLEWISWVSIGLNFVLGFFIIHLLRKK